MFLILINIIKINTNVNLSTKINSSVHNLKTVIYKNENIFKALS